MELRHDLECVLYFSMMKDFIIREDLSYIDLSLWWWGWWHLILTVLMAKFSFVCSTELHGRICGNQSRSKGHNMLRSPELGVCARFGQNINFEPNWMRFKKELCASKWNLQIWFQSEVSYIGKLVQISGHKSNRNGHKSQPTVILISS